MIDSGLVAKLRSDDDAFGQWPSAVPGAGQWWHDFFPLAPDANGRIESEDWSFCHLVRQCGMSVWCDPSLRMRNWGQFPFDVADPMNVMLQQPAEAGQERAA